MSQPGAHSWALPADPLAAGICLCLQILTNSVISYKLCFVTVPEASLRHTHTCWCVAFISLWICSPHLDQWFFMLWKITDISERLMEVMDIFPPKSTERQSVTHSFKVLWFLGEEPLLWSFSIRCSVCFLALSETWYLLVVNSFPRRCIFPTLSVLFEKKDQSLSPKSCF